MIKDLSELTDEELIAEFQANENDAAYEILVKRYKDALVNFVFRYLGDKDASNDIVQDTMIRFYLHKNSYKSFAKFSTWIYTIASNLAKNELKRRKRKRLVSIFNDEDEEQIDLIDKEALPDVVSDSKIKEEMVQQALARVKDIYREVIVLRDIQDLTYEEISEVLNLSVGTVKSRINRGRLQLQNMLKNIYNE